MSKIYTKYKFRVLPLLVLGTDNKFYRLPYCNGTRNYELKELTTKEHKGEKKLLYLNKRYTKGKLNSLKEEYVIFLKESVNSLEILLNQLNKQL